MIRFLFTALLFTITGAAQAAAYLPSGVQQNVPVSTVTNGGWSECYRDTYADSGTPISSILNSCNGANLMLACRPTGNPTLTLLAQAPRADVTFDTGGNDYFTTHTANGVAWYFNANYSWGFTGAGNSVYKSECDTNAGNDRLCWHTLGGGGSLSDGYRCGDNSLNGDSGWERIVYTSDATALAAIPSVTGWGIIFLACLVTMGAISGLRRERRL